MKIFLNGEQRELPDGTTLADAVTATAPPVEERGIAAALDGEVIPRDQWQQTPLRQGQSVEVVQAVQGG